MKAMIRFHLLLGLMAASGICDVVDDKNDITVDVKQCNEATDMCGRVERLEYLVLQQNTQLHELNEFIRQQTGVLRAQKAKLADQEEKLTQQQTTLKQLLNEKIKDRASLSNGVQPFKPIKLYDVEHSGPSMHQDAHSVTSSDLRVHHGADSVTAHDVKSRSDDGGPLDAVVLQLSQQLTAVQADVQVLKTEALQNAPSSIFIHWGSSSCTDHSQLVYSGVMGGGQHQYYGSDANHLCMTMSPVVSNHTVAGTLGFLAGTEYETGDSHQDKDAVCAVCQSNHATTIMIPGTDVCTTGWTKQYSGIIMGGYYAHPSASEFICVDSAMESLVSGDRNDNGRLLYYVVTVCGSLPCQPYVNNKMVTCVVCSR